ncbi:MAG: Holliday junction branch migration protein RuvA [Pseudomonadota bacterium]
MIGKLRGLLDELNVQEGYAIIDVGGVGYIVRVSQSASETLQQKPAKTPVELFIHTHVRESQMELYGFLQENGVALHQMLLKVQGVGSRIALAIADLAPMDQLMQAIEHGDAAFFTAAPGVGKRLAVRLVSELKDATLASPITIDATGAKPSLVQDATSALSNLGFSARDAGMAVGKAFASNPQASLEDLITAALKDLPQS